jgi:hypothetical protein
MHDSARPGCGSGPITAPWRRLARPEKAVQDEYWGRLCRFTWCLWLRQPNVNFELGLGGTRIAGRNPEFTLADNENYDMTVVPIPASESEAEHDRIRKSNDRDQELEREGKVSRHNRGYDEAADGVVRPPEIERVADE